MIKKTKLGKVTAVQLSDPLAVLVEVINTELADTFSELNIKGFKVLDADDFPIHNNQLQKVAIQDCIRKEGELYIVKIKTL